MLCFLLFLIVNADDSCEKRTKIYNYNENSNMNYFYFDERTYTENTKSMTPQAYKDNIRSTINCTGVWCVDKQWKCNIGNTRNTRDCYNVEHIIPEAHTILEIYGCPTAIQGNLIMAYGAWNQQMSNSYYGEKANIYGSSIFKSAYKSVYKACYDSDPIIYPEELCLLNKPNIYIGVILLVISLILLSVAILLFIKYKNNLTNEFYSDIKSLFK